MVLRDEIRSGATDMIVDAVSASGGKPYFVGGCVRDAIIGRPCKDRDIVVTGLDPDELARALPENAKFVGDSFGVFKVKVGDETVDVANARIERSTGFGHRDFDVELQRGITIEQDLSRRDFSMNAIAVDCLSGEVIDPFGGQKQINERLIQTVGVPDLRFADDALRMFRAVRFSAQLDFVIESSTIQAIQRNSNLAEHLSYERIRDELEKTLMTRHASNRIWLLHELGLLAHAIPEWEKLIGFEQRNHHHMFPVDEHVFHALNYVSEMGGSLRCRWAVLLHDIEKPDCFSLDGEGHGHFYGHEEAGAETAREILNRLRCDGKMVSDVSKIVREHLRPPSDASDRVLRRYSADMGELTEDAILCRAGDVYGHKLDRERAAEVIELGERIKKFPEVSGFNESKLALRGDEIAKIFGVSGRKIGEIKKLATEWVIAGSVPNEREKLVEQLSYYFPSVNLG